MVGLLTSWRRSNPPRPDDWSWVKDFLRELDTRQLLEGSEIPALNPEVEARTLCIETLKKFCKAYQTGNNELAWEYLEAAKKTYELVRECRTGWKLAIGEFWRYWLVLEGPKKRRLSQHPIFKEIVRLDGMDADEILMTIMSMEQARRRLSTPPRPTGCPILASSAAMAMSHSISR